VLFLKIHNFFTGGTKVLNDPMKRAMEGFIGSLTGVLNRKKKVWI
jgi:hypothetical protein